MPLLQYCHYNASSTAVLEAGPDSTIWHLITTAAAASPPTYKFNTSHACTETHTEVMSPASVH